MKGELTDLGHDVNMVAINPVSGLDFQSTLVNVCTFPLLQDTSVLNTWEAMAGAKDDIYIYGSDGKLVIYLRNGGSINTNLATGDGYSNVRDILMAVE